MVIGIRLTSYDYSDFNAFAPHGGVLRQALSGFIFPTDAL